MTERDDVAVGGHVLHAAGLSDFAWGHVSARDPDGRGVWMKPANLGFDEVATDDLLLVSWDGDVLDGTGPRHSEWPMHTEVLRTRPDLGSVVHCHPPHAIALAASATKLTAFSRAGGVFARGVPIYHDAPGLVATVEQGSALAAAIGDARGVILESHGVLTVGATVGVAVMAAVMLERACELQFLAQGFGGLRAPRDAARAERDFPHTLTDAHLLGAWEYSARSARRAHEAVRS